MSHNRSSGFTPRTDGLYVSELVPPQDDEKEGCYTYLRYYPDGTLYIMFSSGTPQQVSQWLRPGFAASVGPHPYDAVSGSFVTQGEFHEVQHTVRNFTGDTFERHYVNGSVTGMSRMTFVAV